jgi:hypothetical protein
MRSLHVRAESSIVGYGGSSSFLLLLPLFILKIFMKFGVITMGSTPPPPTAGSATVRAKSNALAGGQNA